MKYFTQEALMNELCQHCDSHIEMCEDCPMKEMIKEIPTSWIACNDRLPEESGRYLVCDVPYKIMSVVPYSAKWKRFNCYDSFDEEYVKGQEDYLVTHWMPLPDAPGVEG